MPNFQTITFDVSAAVSGPSAWRRLTWTTPQTARAITGTLTSGDTIRVDMTLESLVAERNVMSTTVSAQTYAPSSSYTATNFEFGYTGAFSWVRVVKTGTNGAARVVIEG